MELKTLSIVIFLLTYFGIALGGIPGFKLDRTGVALIGAIAMVVSGVLSTSDAVGAIDFPTILLLYAMMVVSAQFRLGGFYTKAAVSITGFLKKPKTFLFILMLKAAVLSALLSNDVVCLAFTPIICVSVLSAGLNPAPFLIGLAVASNIGSAATVIGNPQNMLIAQVSGLDFGRFFLFCLPPSLISLVAAYLVILGIYFRGFSVKAEIEETLPRPTPLRGTRSESGSGAPTPYDSRQSLKGVVVLSVLVLLFFTSIPREVSAILAAGALLCSRRMATREILGLVDWHLLTLFAALFIVVEGVVRFGLPSEAIAGLASYGIDMNNAFSLSAITLVLSNIVSNVPAVMILLKNMDFGATEKLYFLSLVSTFAGNLILIGSIANLITFEQARAFNVKIGFWEHAKTGIPVTIASVGIAIIWYAF